MSAPTAESSALPTSWAGAPGWQQEVFIMQQAAAGHAVSYLNLHVGCCLQVLPGA